MERSTLFALLATLLYAVANVLIEHKFAKLNSLTIMLFYAVPIFFFGLVGRQIIGPSDPSLTLPVGSEMILLIILGLIIAGADYFYISAYTNKGGLLTITSILAMMPVVASLLKFALTRAWPNWWEVGGYLLALGAVLMVAKGSTTT